MTTGHADAPPVDRVRTDSSADIRLSGLRKSYGEVLALDGIDLEVRAGEFFTLLGPSGSGKTTSLRLIAALSFDEIAVTFFLAGADTTTLPLWILGAFRNAQSLPEVNAAATVILIISLPMIAVAAWLRREDGGRSRVAQVE